MAIVCALLIALPALAARIAYVPAADWHGVTPLDLWTMVLAAFPAIAFHYTGRIENRDSALVLPWIVALACIMPHLVIQCALFRFPLRDALFVRLDHALGFHVPAIMAWSLRYHLSGALGVSYSLLIFMMGAAALLPAVLGHKRAAEGFLVANAVIFFVTLPVIAWLPAIGPWAGFGFAANADQQATEASIMALEYSGKAAIAGIVCFPSFHVIWAILSAWALWPIKWLRIPAAVLAGLIVISTVTTGWHYGVDVLGGIAFAGVAVYCAEAFNRVTKSGSVT